MTAVHTQAASEELHATSVIDCGSALLTAQAYDWLTIVTISGEMDATNSHEMTGHLVGLVSDGGAVIIDMAYTDFVGVDGLRTLFALSAECVRTDTRLAVIGSHAVHRLLRVGDREQLVPAVRSATEALQIVRSRRKRRALQLVT